MVQLSMLSMSSPVHAPISQTGVVPVARLRCWPARWMPGKTKREVIAKSTDVDRSGIGKTNASIGAGAKFCEELTAAFPLRSLAHVINGAADTVTTVNRVLWSAQYFDTVDIEPVRVDAGGTTREHGLTRLIDRDSRLTQVIGTTRGADTTHRE